MDFEKADRKRKDRPRRADSFERGRTPDFRGADASKALVIQEPDPHQDNGDNT